MFHSGCIAAAALFSIQVAKPSLSQMLSHHCMVTRSPNHWCAISWATTRATFFFASMEADLRIEQQVGLAVGDGAEVLHGAGLEVGNGDEVELLERVGNAEVSVVVVQDILGGFEA